MTDDSFLQAIRAAPNDEALRLVYADWLEDRDDPRAEVVRLECELATLPPADGRHATLQARLRALGGLIDPTWLATISRVPIENCGVEFRFRCPKRWEQLKSTADESIRFCEVCKSEVFFCATIRVAQTHAALGECIAVDPRLVRRPDDLESNLWEMELAVGIASIDEEPPPKDDAV